MQRTKKIILGALALTAISVTLIQMSANSKITSDLVVSFQSAPSKSSLSSNRYTQKETDLAPTSNPYITLNGYELIASNEVSKLSLFVNMDDLSFRVRNDETGYIFGSNIEIDYLDPNDPNFDETNQNLNQTWRNRVKSPIAVAYYTGSNLQEEFLFQNPGSSFTYDNYQDGEKKGFEARLDFALSRVKLTVRVYIDQDGLSIEIPNDQIVEDPSSGETARKLAAITPYPYFGATLREVTSGYVFVPDGVGALMRFKDRPRTGTYSKRFFGNESLTGLTEESLFANVYGMVHGINQNGFLAIIEKGGAQGSLVYTPSGEPTDLNYLNVSYEYRIAYTQYLNQSQTSSIRMVQDKRNEFDIKVSYRFLSNLEANYVGMANVYQTHLVNEGSLEKVTGDQIGLHLDVLMAENKKSLFGRRTFKMTSYNALIDMILRLNEVSITNLDLTLHGFNKGGFSYQGPNYDKLESSIGRTSDLKRLLAMDVSVYFNTNYVLAHRNASGYNMKNISQTIGQQLLIINDNYVLSLEDSIKMFQSDYNKLSSYGIENIAFDLLGNALFRDYSSKLTREAMIKVSQSFLEVSNKSSVSNAFSYLFSADVIKDSPMYSSQQLRFSDTVPFYSYVLSGHQTVYARNANFFSNTSNELLRMIDYNLYPSFIVTEESSYLLLDTGSSHIFTSRFDDWFDEINRQYHYVNDALKHVIGSQVIERVVLDVGIVKVTYGNGVSIVINYTGKDFVYLGNSVDAMDYEVIR